MASIKSEWNVTKQKADERLASLESELIGVRLEVSAKSKEVVELKAQVVSLDQRSTLLEASLADARRQLTMKQSELEVKDEQLATVQRNHLAQRRLLDSSETEIKSLQGRLALSEQHQQEHQQAMVLMGNRHDKVVADLRVKAQTIEEEAQAQGQLLNKTIDSLKSVNLGLQGQLAIVEKQKTVLAWTASVGTGAATIGCVVAGAGLFVIVIGGVITVTCIGYACRNKRFMRSVLRKCFPCLRRRLPLPSSSLSSSTPTLVPPIALDTIVIHAPSS